MAKRITVTNNSNLHDSRVMLVPEHILSIRHLLVICSQKFGMNAQKLFLANGGEIDHIDMIRDDDNIYVSAGEPFFKNGEKLRLYSIAVMGPGSVGKSAMTLQFVQGVFVSDYDPTIEDAYRKPINCDGEQCMLDILDTAGQEEFTALRSTWMRERDGFLLVFSLTDRSTFDVLQNFYEQLCDIHEDEDDGPPPIIIVGNKADLAREVSAEEGKELAESFGDSIYIETSALTGFNIDDCFQTLIKEVRKRRKLLEPEPKIQRKKSLFSFCNIL